MILSPFEEMLRTGDPMQLRAYYESLRARLNTEKSTWDRQWGQLARYLLPYSPRFNYSNVDMGERRDGDIVDNTATLATRVLKGGMASCITNASQEWFHIESEDDSVNDLPEVREYFQEGADIVRKVFARGNFYPTMVNYYGELGVFGTSCFALMEDAEDTIRCYPYPMGSYCISGDSTLRIQLTMRAYEANAFQLVEQFGYQNCSSALQSYYDSTAGGVKEQWWPVVQFVHKASYYGERAVKSGKYKPWVRVVYELGALGNKAGPTLLCQDGFYENPIITTRWDVIGEDFYGRSPGMDVLGDVMGLQLNERRITEATDKMVKPPMVADSRMQNAAMSILPGGITYADTRDGKAGFHPAFQLDFKTQEASNRSDLMRQRIKTGLFQDLFLMIAGSDRREITAEEIRAKLEERLLVLGPVLERVNDEGLKPIVERSWAICRRAGLIRKPPEVLKGKEMRFRFETVLSQALRLKKTAGMDRLTDFVEKIAQVDQTAPMTIDTGAMIREYAKDLAVPPSIMRDQKQVDKMVAAQQKQQQQAHAADIAQKMGQAAQSAANAPTDGNTALSLLTGQQAPP